MISNAEERIQLMCDRLVSVLGHILWIKCCMHTTLGFEVAHYWSWQSNLFSQIWTGEKIKEEMPPGATANNPDSLIFLLYNSTEAFRWNSISNFELERSTLRMRFSLIILGNGIKPQLPDSYMVSKVHTGILHCPWGQGTMFSRLRVFGGLFAYNELIVI